jgi:DNA-binding NarL/FixJ family response regulator
MTDSTIPIRILVADDHPIVRDGLVAVLSTQTDLDVVGEAADGRQVVEQALALQPDVILLDLEMPEVDGVQALEQLRKLGQVVRAVVFTAFDTDERILSALRAGAKGYLLKGAPREELFNAVRVVHAGGSLLQPVVASRLLERFSEASSLTTTPEMLTPREVEVLALVAQGLPNKEIAERLAISQRTVKFHVSSIMGKLGAANRTEAVAFAVQQGLIER